MKLKKSKCQMLYQGKVNPRFTYKLGVKRLENSPKERNLGILIDAKLNGN